jgi:hypothetical protein
VQNKEKVCAILNINVKALTEKYLGLPAQVGMDRTHCFQYLVDRVCQIISGWNKKNLSMGEKEILLKAVAHVIPSYAMSVFKLPKGMRKAIAVACSLLVGREGCEEMYTLVLLVENVYAKKARGLGFRDLHCFNLVMLEKQIWSLAIEPESLCAQVLRAKYYPSGDLLRAELKKGALFTWQSLMAGMETFKRGHIWRVGNGDNINVWQDP